MDGMKRANPAYVVSTNNTRVVPNRRNATPKEIEEFKKTLRAKKDYDEKKADKVTKEPNPKKAKSEDKS